MHSKPLRHLEQTARGCSRNTAMEHIVSVAPASATLPIKKRLILAIPPEPKTIGITVYDLVHLRHVLGPRLTAFAESPS